MLNKDKNTQIARIKRMFTSPFPISKRRKGKCVNCGACCKLPTVCPFLKFKPNGKSYCSINLIKPLSCRKYPRTKSEWLTEDTCRFRFD